MECQEVSGGCSTPRVCEHGKTERERRLRMRVVREMGGGAVTGYLKSTLMCQWLLWALPIQWGTRNNVCLRVLTVKWGKQTINKKTRRSQKVINTIKKVK